MGSAIWVNPRQPQTLYIAQILMYIRGGLAILFGGALGSIGSTELFGSKLIAAVFLLLLTIGLIAAAFGIANEKRWGYRLGVTAAIAPLVITVYVLFPDELGDLVTNGNIAVSVLFDVALLALLLHEQSREYQRIWFR
jgi:hypothetical protein